MSDSIKQYLNYFMTKVFGNDGQTLVNSGIKRHGMSSHVEIVPYFNNTATNQLLSKVISTLIGLGISSAVTYFLIKWVLENMDPTRKEKLTAKKQAEELLRKIGVDYLSCKLTEYELCVAADLVSPVDIPVSWASIGGLQTIISDMQETIILPFARRDLFADSELLSAPKGVLLYGPPGCGKTMIAKATAKASGVRFINLQISSMMDKWYGESQKRVAAIYSLAQKIQPVIIFIDEIDAFLRSRSSHDHEATAMMKTQFMAFWDGLITDSKCQILIMGATNRPEDVDAAILRRMPSKFHVPLPGCDAREDILRTILSNKEPVSPEVDLREIARLTEGFSGSDLRELCRNAALTRVRDYLQRHADSSGTTHSIPDKVRMRLIEMRDFKTALEKMRKQSANQIKSTLSTTGETADYDYFSRWLAAAYKPKTCDCDKKKQEADDTQDNTGASVDDVIDDLDPE